MLSDAAYILIGKATVGLLAGVVSAFAGILAAYLVAHCWRRFWLSVTELMWRGYSVTGETPPPRRRKVAIIAHSLARLDLSDMRMKLARVGDPDPRENGD